MGIVVRFPLGRVAARTGARGSTQGPTGLVVIFPVTRIERHGAAQLPGTPNASTLRPKLPAHRTGAAGAPCQTKLAR
jgi:hypothetical protein